MATANVADKMLGCRIERADDSRIVEDELGTPTLSRAFSTSPPTPRPEAITEVSLIGQGVTRRSLDTDAWTGPQGGPRRELRSIDDEIAVSDGDPVVARHMSDSGVAPDARLRPP